MPWLRHRLSRPLSQCLLFGAPPGLLLCAFLAIALLITATPAQAGSISWAPVSAKEVTRTLALNSPDNHTRFLNLQKLLDAAGCHKEYMEELHVAHAPEPDLICTIPGVQTPPGGPDSRRVIIIARYDHIGSGSGAVDNWTGAAMLPILFASIYPGYREHTMQFVATCGPDGLRAFLKHLTRQEKESTVALVDLRDLGMEATRIAMLYDASSDVNSAMLGRGSQSGQVTRATRDSAAAVQAAATSATSFTDANGPASADLRVYAMRAAAVLTRQPPPTIANSYIEGFTSKPQTARDEADVILESGIPGVVIHSITKANAAVPGSKADLPDLIGQTAYYDTYCYTAVYLLLLDHRPDLSSAAKTP